MTDLLCSELENSHSSEEILKHVPWYSQDAALQLPYPACASSYISHGSKTSPAPNANCNLIFLWGYGAHLPGCLPVKLFSLHVRWWKRSGMTGKPHVHV